MWKIEGNSGKIEMRGTESNARETWQWFELKQGWKNYNWVERKFIDFQVLKLIGMQCYW